MDYNDSPKKYADPSWTPHTPPQRHPEQYDMSVCTSPPRSDNYYLTPPITSGQHPDYTAPELAQPYPDPYDKSRPLSPASGVGSSTIYSNPLSPSIPPYAQTEKEAVPQPPPPPLEEPRRCGLRRRWFNIVLLIFIIVVLVLGLSLGLGLGLGLKKDKSSASGAHPSCISDPDLCIGGYLDENFYSKKGAFNGSGIALAGESWNRNQRKIFTLYFQHWTGDIRYMQYGPDQKWIGGERGQTVATDAKNATPISTVAYVLNGTQYFHLFYISKNNTLRQITNTNVTNIWQQGSLSSLNLSVYDSPSVGLQACWKGNFYGDSDYSKFPTFSGEQNQIPFEDRIGMNIWYAKDDSTFQQYAWYNGQEDWVAIQEWRGMNTHAGVGCYSWGVGTVTYAMMVNKDNDTEIWWKDTNITLTSEDKHPINSWVNSTNAAIGDVYPASSMGFTTFFYAQMADKTIKGFNITYDAENTTIETQDTFTIGGPAGALPGLGGTHLTVTAYAEKDGNDETIWDSLYVFYQRAGDDITAFTRPIQGGEWANGEIPIPLD
ncbi:hypothetical protein CC78DRAFT_605597 [Lojkania enalia]|uniref:Fucose-specific lectin n=1 Tax=Lojkania enalia TaxID=147567 RepID=A0A9P4N9T7_9PLEO|nr:hypothetical protein CC78DRAFT_605597 [Didymosphaeria enalia]